MPRADGTFSQAVSDDIILDPIPPQGEARIVGTGTAPAGASRAAAAVGPVVTVLLNATDNRIVAQMRLSNRPTYADDGWQPYSPSTTWDLAGGNTVYVWFRDGAGNVSSRVAATVPGQTDCLLRPSVQVTSAPASGDRLQVTITASGLGNTLQAIRFDDPRPSTNALIDVPGGQQGASGAFTLTLPAGTTQTTFFVRRSAAGQSTTVHLTSVDRCGDWPTLVGGGPNAF